MSKVCELGLYVTNWSKYINNGWEWRGLIFTGHSLNGQEERRRQQQLDTPRIIAPEEEFKRRMA